MFANAIMTELNVHKQHYFFNRNHISYKIWEMIMKEKSSSHLLFISYREA